MGTCLTSNGGARTWEINHSKHDQEQNNNKKTKKYAEAVNSPQKTNQETKTKVYKQRKFKIKEICLKLCIT